MSRTVYVELKFTQRPDNHPDGSRWQPWSAVIMGGNYEPLFRSTESWTNEADARDALALAFGDDTNVYLKQFGKETVPLRMARVGADPVEDNDDDDEAWPLGEVLG